MKTLLILLFALFSISGFAQQQMETKEDNFTSFGVQKIQSLQVLRDYIPKDYWSHPEFGVLNRHSPCTDCVELLHKRTSTEKLYVDMKNPTKVYAQTFYSPIHYTSGKDQVTIDPTLKPLNKRFYCSYQQSNPTELDVINKTTSIKQNRKIIFNNWTLFTTDSSNVSKVYLPDWSHYTVGEDGIWIKDIFNGIDCKILFREGSIKTDFVIKRKLSHRIMKFVDGIKGDTILSKQDGNLQTHDFLIQQPFWYDASGNKTIYQKEYEYGINYYSIEFKDSDFVGKIFPITVDPLVSATNTLAQASITGSGYNATCFNGFCSYNLTVNTPANITVTDIRWSFAYRAISPCWMSDGANTFLLGGCISPSAAGFFWFCNTSLSGTCTGTNISVFNDLKTCVPAPQCPSYPLTFTMRFHRCFSAGAGCSNACIGSNSAWSMTVEGHTLEVLGNVGNSPFVVNTTGSCGVNSVLNPSPNFGVPPYTFAWTNPVVTTSTYTINQNFNGTTTTAVTVTDACGIQRLVTYNFTVNDCALSVDNLLLSSVVDENNFVKVNWNSVGEKNSQGYNIQRSINGIEYVNVGFSKAIGAPFYTFKDYSPINGQRYFYRIEEVSLNGNTQFSNVIEHLVSLQHQTKFSLYNRNNYIDYEMFDVVNGNIEIMLYDASGKLIIDYETPSIIGTIKGSEGLAKGFYGVVLKYNGQTLSNKIFKN